MAVIKKLAITTAGWVVGQFKLTHYQKWREYVQYLESLRNRIPQSALEFATAPWHYDTSDHRSLHDSWVESLVISEPSQGDRHEIRSVEVEIRLLGPYHDGNRTLRYQELLSYSLNTQGESKYAPRPNVGHGDWLCDEVRLSEKCHVLHEIEFRHGSRWVIDAGILSGFGNRVLVDRM